MEVRAVSHDEEGRKRVEKVEVPETRRPDSMRHFEKKLVDKGVQRMDRHPSDGVRVAKPPPKSGHGGKFTWEGPEDLVESELDPVPAAIDEKDPNYAGDEEVVQGEEDDETGGSAKASELIVGEVEVAKLAHDGVSRIEVRPPLQP